jgi:hypothetical protein
MKTYLLFTVLLGTLLSAVSSAQEPFEGEPVPEEEMEREMHTRNMQLEQQQHEAQMDLNQKMRELELKKQRMALQQHEAEMDFNQKMRELELKKQQMALEQERKPQKYPPCFAHCRGAKMLPFLVICCIVHVLVAVWVYQDLRSRNAGSGIWIVITLLTGLFGALVYAVVRLGDSRKTQ